MENEVQTENVNKNKELFNKHKDSVAKLFTIKWISLIVIIASLIAITFIPFIKVGGMSSFFADNKINIGSEQISQIQTKFDTQLEDCKKEAKEMKEYLSKEEYNLLFGDLEHDAFEPEAFTDFWKEINTIIENGLSETDKKQFKGLTKEQKDSMIEAYITSLKPSSLFTINFGDKITIQKSQNWNSLTANPNPLAMMFNMYGSVIFYIYIACAGLALLFVSLGIVKFLKKDNQSYTLYFEKNIIKKDVKRNIVKSNPDIFFSSLYLILAVVYALMLISAGGFKFTVAWPVIFAGLFVALFLAGCVYPSILKKKIENTITKEKYE